MTLQDVFAEMYDQCEEDWITQQLLQPCLPSSVRSNGTYDYEQAEIQRACELPQHAFNRWCKFDRQYLSIAAKRYQIHLAKLRLFIQNQRKIH